jgi:hypothetical protein
MMMVMVGHGAAGHEKAKRAAKEARRHEEDTWVLYVPLAYRAACCLHALTPQRRFRFDKGASWLECARPQR